MPSETSLLRLGYVSYINALPIYGALIRREIEPGALLVSGYPTQLNEKLLKGELDISLMSSIEYLRHQDQLALLPGLCLAASEQVRSTLLYVRKEITSLEGKRVGLSTQSASAAQLLKVLCSHFWNVRPEYVALNAFEDYVHLPAVMLIGDEALIHQELPGYNSIDLARAWNVRTLLPFVFAVFATRREVMQKRGDEVVALANQLERSLQWSEAHLELICQMAMAQSRLPRQLILHYYSLLQYRMNRQTFDGLRLFASFSHLTPPLWEEPSAKAQESLK